MKEKDYERKQGKIEIKKNEMKRKNRRQTKIHSFLKTFLERDYLCYTVVF
jgi:hypothetical protein